VAVAAAGVGHRGQQILVEAVAEADRGRADALAVCAGGRSERGIESDVTAVSIDEMEPIKLLPSGPTGQPALAAYTRDPADGVHRAYGVMVFAIDGDRIAGITGFPQPPPFARLGVPEVLG
jgi:hypothetical protein